MRLTVLTPTLNCGETLAHTFRSVEALERRLPGEIQHLIGDSGSSDATIGIIAEYVRRNAWAAAQDFPRFNIPATLNRLLEHANGTWIVVLNGDDVFDTDALHELLSVGLPVLPSIVCGQVSVIASDGSLLGFRDCDPAQLSRFMSVNHPAMVAERRVFHQAGVFDEQVSVAYDYVWAWRAFRAGVPFVRYPRILAQARLGGISQTRAYQGARQTFRAKLRAGCVLPACREYAMFLVKSWFRKTTSGQLRNFAVRQYRRLSGTIEHY